MKHYIYYRMSDGRVVNRRSCEEKYPIDVQRELQDYGSGFDFIEVLEAPPMNANFLRVENGTLKSIKDPAKEKVKADKLIALEKLKRVCNLTDDEVNALFR